MTGALDAYDETESCACDDCKSMCNRPGWPTPDEARQIIEAGYAEFLMLDFWVVTGGSDIEALCPAGDGYESQSAPSGLRVTLVGCVMQDDDGFCELHGTGYKPAECRMTSAHNASAQKNGLHKAVAEMWDTAEGRKVVRLWQDTLFQAHTEV